MHLQFVYEMAISIFVSSLNLNHSLISVPNDYFMQFEYSSSFYLLFSLIFFLNVQNVWVFELFVFFLYFIFECSTFSLKNVIIKIFYQLTCVTQFDSTKLDYEITKSNHCDLLKTNFMITFRFWVEQEKNQFFSVVQFYFSLDFNCKKIMWIYFYWWKFLADFKLVHKVMLIDR